MTILKHLIYKEWLKTKWFATIALSLNMGVLIYIVISLRSSFLSVGGVAYLSALMTYKTQFFSIYRYIPLALALLIGISQFAPEITDKRIKLALHLPLSNLRIIYTMVLYGCALLALCMIPGILIFTGLISIYLPAEITVPVLQTMLPWMLGGFCAYFLIAMIALEPVWKFRFLYILVSYKVLSLFFMQLSIGNAVSLLPLLCLITCLSGIAPVYTSYRFNKGQL
ncbi:MAG: hypothetical protein K2L23_09310 [Odoribacter sp.]|nr:hypothetical protein [Odoribacter sp.]